MSNVFSAFLTNKNEYWNNQNLVGEWVEFPTTKEKIEEVFERIGVKNPENVFITDTDYVSDLPKCVIKCIGEYEDLNELNYFASLIEEAESGYDNGASVKAILEAEGSEKSISKNIELILNEENFVVYTYVKDEYDLGEHYIEECYNIPDNLKYYFDYEQFGSDVSSGEGGEFTGWGYVYEDEYKHVDYTEIPEEYHVI